MCASSQPPAKQQPSASSSRCTGGRMAYLFVRVSVEAEDVGDSLHEVERHAARASRIAQARRSPLRPRYLFVLSLLPCPLCARRPVVFLFDVVNHEAQPTGERGLDRLGECLSAPPEFMTVISYNPGYQSITRTLKESTRQRFVSIAFDYPTEEAEAEIVARESGCEPDVAQTLVRLGRATRNLRSHGLREGASTRLLVYAGSLIESGMHLEPACRATIVQSLTDDAEMHKAIEALLKSVQG